MPTNAIREAQANRNEVVLTHLTAAAQKISPCPDDGRLHPADGEVASAFRAAHGRWPLWWEMAVASRAAASEETSTFRVHDSLRARVYEIEARSSDAALQAVRNDQWQEALDGENVTPIEQLSVLPGAPSSPSTEARAHDHFIGLTVRNEGGCLISDGIQRLRPIRVAHALARLIDTLEARGLLTADDVDRILSE